MDFNLLNSDTIRSEQLWTYHDGLVSQQIEAGIGKVREELLSNL